MSAKKTTTPTKRASKKKLTIISGKYRDSIGTEVLDKELSDDKIKINLVDGPIIIIPRIFIK